jgi:hypothetical protein
MTNPFRGELQIKLGGKSYKTRITVEGCMQIETACEMSLVKLATKLSEGDLKVADVSNILTPALRGGGNNVDLSEVAKLIYEAGLTEGMRVAAELLSNVLLGGTNLSEEDGGTEKNDEPTLLAQSS